MTYSLGTTSRANLQGVHPDLVRVVEAAIKRSPQDFAVREGLRDIEQQRRNLAKGVSATLNSKHLRQPDGFSHAVDLVPFVDGKLLWIWGEPGEVDAHGQPIGGCYAIAAAMRLAAVDLGVSLRWGGQWDVPLSSLPEAPAGIRRAHHDYAAAFHAQHGRAPLCDGPHFELRGAAAQTAAKAA